MNRRNLHYTSQIGNQDIVNNHQELFKRYNQ